MQPQRSRVLATSFVTDLGHEGTIFPAAGGNSADPKVQAVYWRCIAVFYYSARINNPQLSLVFFTNYEPPVLDGVPFRSILEKLGVEIVLVPMTHRFTDKRSQSWGNVLYFLDIMDRVERDNFCDAIMLVDSDVVVVGNLDAMYATLSGREFVGYAVHRPVDENINGLSRLEMTQIAAEVFDVHPSGPVTDFGGELFACTLAAWRRNRHIFDRIYDLALNGDGLLKRISTEEHFYSLAYAVLGDKVGVDTTFLKRLWTAYKFSTVRPGDENYAIWHLPAEKRYGIADLYAVVRDGGFDLAMSPAAFKALAQRQCGIPRRGPVKSVRDFSRKAALKLGWA